MKIINNKSYPILILLVFVCSLTFKPNKIFADTNNCSGFVFTDQRSGKSACILDGWKKETRNSTMTSSDHFYYKETDFFVTLDTSPYYDYLTDEDQKRISREQLNTYTLSNEMLDVYASSVTNYFESKFGIPAESIAAFIGNQKWIKTNFDFSSSGINTKTSMLSKIVDGYLISISYSQDHIESEELAYSIAKDIGAQIKYPYSKDNDPFVEVSFNDAFDDAISAAIKTFLIGSSISFIIFKIVNKIRNKSKNNNAHIRNVNASIGDNANPITDFYNRIFPNGNKEHIKNQMRIITNNTTTDDENIRLYIYCMSHYLVNNKSIEHVKNVLPISHPEVKDPEIINKIAEYTLACSLGNPLDVDISNSNHKRMIKEIRDEFERLDVIRKYNTDKNKTSYDENVGLMRNKPMYFKGATRAEKYLNSLTDELGNQLHIGSRYSYSVDDIPEMLDCYQILDKNNNTYGSLYVSIYGMDDYKYAPKGYKQNIKNIKTDTQNLDSNTSKENTTIKNNILVKKENESTYEREKYTTIMPNLKHNNVEKPRICFCRKCGTMLSGNELFCRKCGIRIGE